MDLKGIREALADTLAEIPSVRTFYNIPKPLPVGAYDAIVVQPDSPYVEFSEVAGLVNKNYVNILLTVVTQSTDPRTAQDRVDELLSCGADQPRSIRTKLAGNINASGEACQVTVRSATTRQVTIEGVEEPYWGADVSLQILARC
jgi:hypothetical protein